MRIRTPDPFSIKLLGPQGLYTLAFCRYASSEWEGFLDVEAADHTMRWEVESVDDEDGVIVLSGGTGFETVELWGDSFWYRLFPFSDTPHIEFWGDRVLCRTDYKPKI
jgi:hypothetical protein